MRAAGLTDLSLRALISARRMLEGSGLLQLVGKHRAGSHCQSFTLIRPRPGQIDAGNVLMMPRPDLGRGQRTRGGGAKITYDVQK